MFSYYGVKELIFVSITILTPTNRKSNTNNIIENFLRQNFDEKELIVLLNYDNPDLAEWRKIISIHKNISVYPLGSKISLGRSLNFGISKAKYDFIAKFDDDDYYGTYYLKNSYDSLKNSNSDIVGKTCFYIYFKDENLIGLKFSSNENKFCRRVAGSTLLFKKDIFTNVKFRDKSLGEDVDFCNDALRNGFKIFSTDRNDYIYIRGNKRYHTWKIDNNYLLRECINLIKAPIKEDFSNLWQVH